MRLTKTLRQIAIVFALLLFASSTFALGVMPMKTTITSETYSGSFIVVNEGGPERSYSVEAAGEMAEYVTLSGGLLNYEEGEERKTVEIRVNAPPGTELTGYVIIRQVTFGGGNTVNTALSIRHKISINIEPESLLSQLLPDDGASPDGTNAELGAPTSGRIADKADLQGAGNSWVFVDVPKQNSMWTVVLATSLLLLLLLLILFGLRQYLKKRRKA